MSPDRDRGRAGRGSREDRGSDRGALRRELGGHRLAALLERDDLARDLERAEHRAALALRRAAPLTIALVRPAWSFSQIRGTPPNQFGRTSSSTEMIWRGFGQLVTVIPKTIGR